MTLSGVSAVSHSLIEDLFFCCDKRFFGCGMSGGGLRSAFPLPLDVAEKGGFQPGLRSPRSCQYSRNSAMQDSANRRSMQCCSSNSKVLSAGCQSSAIATLGLAFALVAGFAVVGVDTLMADGAERSLQSAARWLALAPARFSLAPVPALSPVLSPALVPALCSWLRWGLQGACKGLRWGLSKLRISSGSQPHISLKESAFYLSIGDRLEFPSDSGDLLVVDFSAPQSETEPFR